MSRTIYSPVVYVEPNQPHVRQLLLQVLLMVSVFILSWEYDWIYVALDEFVRFLIIAHLGVTFAPLDPWLLTRAFDHSLEQQGS